MTRIPVLLTRAGEYIDYVTFLVLNIQLRAAANQKIIYVLIRHQINLFRMCTISEISFWMESIRPKTKTMPTRMQ